MLGFGASVSERFATERDGKNENDTSSCCASLVLKDYFNIEAIYCLQGEEEWPQVLFIMSQMKIAAYSWISVWFACKGDCVHLCLHLDTHAGICVGCLE